LKILKFVDADPDPGSGIILAQDPRWKNSDPGIRDKHPGFETEKCDSIDVGTFQKQVPMFICTSSTVPGTVPMRIKMVPTFSVVDSDPDGLGSESFCQIGINSTQIKKLRK
jgi:hypothetical protein